MLPERKTIKPPEFDSEPCKKCGGMEVKVYRYSDKTQKICLDCKSDRERLVRQHPDEKGRGERPARATASGARKKKMAAAAMLGTGVDLVTTAQQTGLTVEGVRQVKKLTLRDPDLMEQFKRGQEQAARDVLPLAHQAAVKCLNKGLALLDGQKAMVGKDKEGNAIIEMIDPHLGHVAQFTREAAAIAGVGKGGVLATDQEFMDAKASAPASDGVSVNIPLNAANIAAILRELAKNEREQSAIDVHGERIG